MPVTQCEEAYEITNEDDFNMLDESIRGAIPPETGLFKQITLTFNPWNEKHWIRTDKETPHIVSMTVGLPQTGRFTPQPPTISVMNGWMKPI